MPVRVLLQNCEGSPFNMASFRHGKDRVSFLTIKGKKNADWIMALIAEHIRPWNPISEEAAMNLRHHRKAIKARRTSAPSAFKSQVSALSPAA